ncbi:hypothetical protein CLOM_g10633 [Closterium sp. NIES-68]|nr:hypothetical protein CLOM_g10633 [Closterium sp. NIES-68]GJP84896.1 hypothetical protein CLOP_g14943 [Closterium sp. NIES-67]
MSEAHALQSQAPVDLNHSAYGVTYSIGTSDPDLSSSELDFDGTSWEDDFDGIWEAERHPRELMAIPLGRSRNATADAKKQQIPDALRYPVCPGVRGRVRLTVGMDTVGTVWKGWGTSLAWSGRYISGLPRRRREFLLDLLFHARKGLGLTIARYTVPGGYDRRYSPRLAQRDVFRGYSDARGRYNWTGDWRQVYALRGAKQRGVEVFDAVCSSPPWWMTKSRDTAGNADGRPNINPDYYDDYAEYIARVLWHLQNDLDIKFYSVAPFNEPLEPWWRKGGVREGCAMSEGDVVQVLGKLRPRLQQYGLDDIFVAGVDSWPSQTLLAMSRVFAQNSDKWEQLNVHGYRSPARMTPGRDERQFNAIRDAARRLGKPLWQTEWGPVNVRGSEMQIACLMARTIIQHVNLMGVEAWYHWLALQQPNPSGWGLIWQGFSYREPFRPVVTKQFWAMLHFTRWMPPGSLPILVRSECQHTVLAVYSPVKHTLAVTVVNQEKRARNLAVQISGYHLLVPQRRTRLLIFRTSSKESYRMRYRAAWPGRRVTGVYNVTAIRDSVTTFVWDNVAAGDDYTSGTKPSWQIY